MRLSEPAGNGQAKAAAMLVASARLVTAIEAVKDMGKILLGDADARITYRQGYQRAGLRYRQTNLTAIGRIFDGVIQEDHAKLAQLARVPDDRYGSQRRDGEPDLLVPRPEL